MVGKKISFKNIIKHSREATRFLSCLLNSCFFQLEYSSWLSMFIRVVYWSNSCINRYWNSNLEQNWNIHKYSNLFMFLEFQKSRAETLRYHSCQSHVQRYTGYINVGKGLYFIILVLWFRWKCRCLSKEAKALIQEHPSYILNFMILSTRI